MRPSNKHSRPFFFEIARSAKSELLDELGLLLETMDLNAQARQSEDRRLA